MIKKLGLGFLLVLLGAAFFMQILAKAHSIDLDNQYAHFHLKGNSHDHAQDHGLTTVTADQNLGIVIVMHGDQAIQEKLFDFYGQLVYHNGEVFDEIMALAKDKKRFFKNPNHSISIAAQLPYFSLAPPTHS